MTTEENTTTLYGNIEQNDYYYLWHSEPGACEKCQALDGKTFDDANTIPDKPHPNCKCFLDYCSTLRISSLNFAVAK